MPTLTITKGLPASGKTTWAKNQLFNEPNTKRVNKDDLRAMIDNGKWSKRNEDYIIKTRDYIVRTALAAGYNIIVDDTNLAPTHEKALRNIATKCEAEFIVKDFTDVPLEECLRRDANRPNYVGEKVIRGMYNTFLKPKVDVAQYSPVEFNPDLPNCIIVDIDGTLAHMSGRSPYDYSKVGTDVVDPIVRDIVHRYQTRDPNEFAPDTYVVIVSGREATCRQETVDWLAENNITYDEFYMRDKGDMRDDRIVKQEIYEKFIKPRYNVRFVLDDRDRVVAMWRSIGLKCLQVAPGAF